MQLGLYSKFIHLYFLVSTLYTSLYLHLYKYKTRPMAEVKNKTKWVVGVF